MVLLAYGDRTFWSILYKRCQADDDENDDDERQEQAIVVHFDEARLVSHKTDLDYWSQGQMTPHPSYFVNRSIFTLHMACRL